MIPKEGFFLKKKKSQFYLPGFCPLSSTCMWAKMAPNWEKCYLAVDVSKPFTFSSSIKQGSFFNLSTATKQKHNSKRDFTDREKTSRYNCIGKKQYTFIQ